MSYNPTLEIVSILTKCKRSLILMAIGYRNLGLDFQAMLVLDATKRATTFSKYLRKA
jgi:hypothetical protein